MVQQHHHHPHHHCLGVVVLCPQEELSAAGGEGAAGQDRDGGEGGRVQIDNIDLSYNKLCAASFISARIYGPQRKTRLTPVFCSL